MAHSPLPPSSSRIVVSPSSLQGEEEQRSTPPPEDDSKQGSTEPPSEPAAEKTEDVMNSVSFNHHLSILVSSQLVSTQTDATTPASTLRLEIKEKEQQLLAAMGEVEEIRQELEATQLTLAHCKDENQQLREKLQELLTSHAGVVHTTSSSVKKSAGKKKVGKLNQKTTKSTHKEVVNKSRSALNKRKSSVSFHLPKLPSQSMRVAEEDIPSNGQDHQAGHSPSGNSQTTLSNFTPSFPKELQSSSLVKVQPMDKNEATLELVADLIQKLNNDQLQDIAQNDSKAIKYVHDELEKMRKMLANFVEQTFGFVCSEGKRCTCHMTIIMSMIYTACLVSLV